MMRLTVAICFILNLQLISYKVSAGYSEMVLAGPIPNLEDYGDGGDRRGGFIKEQKSDNGDGKHRDDSVHLNNEHGMFNNQHDIREEGKRLSQKKKAKSTGAEDKIVFGRKKHGRFEFENGERYEEAGDSGVGREHAWFSGKGDGHQGKIEIGEDGEPLTENRQHRRKNYTHKRRKNFTQLQRNQRVVGNKLNIGDLSRFKKIHRKHFGSGDDENMEPQVETLIGP